MTTTIISSGVTSNHLTVHSGGVLQIDSGGRAGFLTVARGGVVDVLAGGIVSNAVISGVLSGAGLLEGEDFDNLIMGTVSGMTVLNGFYPVGDGGKALSVNVSSGGQLIVDEGAVASGEVIFSGGSMDLAGGVGSGIVVKSGGELIVGDGGTARGDIVSSGGVELLQIDDGSTGVIGGDIIRSGGALAISGEIKSGVSITATASASSAFTDDGAKLQVGAAVEVSGATIDKGGRLTLGASPVLDFISVNAGGVLAGPGKVHSVSDDGLVSGVTLTGRGGEIKVGFDAKLRGVTALRGTEIFLEGGNAAGDVIRNGALEVLTDNAVVNNERVLSGGTVVFGETIASGATVIATGSAASALKFDGFLLAQGADLRVGNATIESGGTLSVAANADPVEVFISSGGLVIGPGDMGGAEDSGLVSGVTLVVGGTLNIFSGGVARGDIVRGQEFVDAGGSAVGELIAGGLQMVDGGAVISGEIIGNGAIVLMGGVASGSIIRSGGRESVGGTARGGVVSAGGLIQLGGVASGVTVLGSLTVQVLAKASNTVIGDGGVVYVSSGGVAHGTIVSSGGEEALHGTAVSNVVQSGGALVYGSGLASGSTLIYFDSAITKTTVLSGVTLSNGAKLFFDGATVSKGAKLVVGGAGVTVSETTVLSGGVVQVDRGAIFSGGTLAVGALLSGAGIIDGFVNASGTISAATIGSGAQVDIHGKAVGVTVAKSGEVDVFSGGSVSGASVASGGLLVVDPEATVGSLTIAGGRVFFDGNMAAGQTVRFAGPGGDLEIASLAVFHAAISGFNPSTQKIDLDDLAFSIGESVSWTQSGTSGTLTVTDGAQVVQLTLIGTYSTGQFHLANDGFHGGTEIGNTAASGGVILPFVTQFIQATGGFGGPSPRGMTWGQSGGTATASGTSPIAAVAPSGH